jgi:predicted CXXCH cytochrome family protein
VLTFFFTGVPPLEKEGQEAVDKGENTTEGTILEVKKNIAQEPKIYSHTPYATKRCNLCHDASAFFGRFGLAGSAGTSRKMKNTRGLLVTLPNKLCVKCHKDKSVSPVSKERLWLHAPAALGKCQLCHAPHQSEYPNILLESPDAICSKCHSEGFVIATADHKKSKDCLSCHNSHLGKNKNLLIKDFKEVKQPVDPVLDLPDPKAQLDDVREKDSNPRAVAEPLGAGAQAVSSSPSKPASMPSLPEAVSAEPGRAGEVSDQGEGGVVKDETESSSPMPERASSIPDLSAVTGAEPGGAEAVSDQGEGGVVEDEAYLPNAGVAKTDSSPVGL